MNNVMVTPHIAGVTNKYWDDQILLFSENLMRYKRNQKLKNLKTYSSIKKDINDWKHIKKRFAIYRQRNY